MRRARLSVALSALLISVSVATTIHTALRQVTRWERRPADCELVPVPLSGLSRLGCGLYALATEAWGWRYDEGAAPHRCLVCPRKGAKTDSPNSNTFLRGMPRYEGVNGFCYASDECMLENGECDTHDRCQCLSGYDFAFYCHNNCFLKFEGFRTEAAIEDGNGTLTLDCNTNHTNDLITGFGFTEDGWLDVAKCPRFGNTLRLGEDVTTLELQVSSDANITEPDLRTSCPRRHVLTGLTMSDGGLMLELRCSRLLHPWVMHHRGCFARPVRWQPVAEELRANASLTWPTQCSQKHQYGIRGAVTNNGTLVKIVCCRVMEDCHHLH